MKKTITGTVSEPIFRVFKDLKDELGIKSYGGLIQRLLLTYRDAQSIVEALHDGELIPVNPMTEEDQIKEMMESSKEGAKICIKNLLEGNLEEQLLEVS